MDKDFTPLTITGDNKIDSKKKNIFQKMTYEYKNNRHKRKKYNIIGGSVLAFLVVAGLGIGLYYGLRPKAAQPDDDVYNAMKADYASNGLNYSYDDFKQDQAAQQKKLSLEELNNKTLRAYLKKLLAASATVKETNLYKNADKTAASQYDAAVDNGNALLGKITDTDDSNDAHDQYLVAINDLVSTLQKLGFKRQIRLTDDTDPSQTNGDSNSSTSDDFSSSDSDSSSGNDGQGLNKLSPGDGGFLGSSHIGVATGSGSNPSSDISDDTTDNNNTDYTPQFGSSNGDASGYFIPDAPDHNLDDDSDLSEPTKKEKDDAQKEVDEYINDELGTHYTVDDVCDQLVAQITDYGNWINNWYGYPSSRGHDFDGVRDYVRCLERYGTSGTPMPGGVNFYPQYSYEQQIDRLISSIYTKREFKMEEITNEHLDGILTKWWHQGGISFEGINKIHLRKVDTQLGSSYESKSTLIADIISSSGNSYKLYLRVGTFNGEVCYRIIEMEKG